MKVARVDHLPDGATYKDTGCEVHPECLSCPLVVCKYDASPPSSAERRLRNAQIVAWRDAGLTTMEIVERTGLSMRSVKRIWAEERAEDERESKGDAA